MKSSLPEKVQDLINYCEKARIKSNPEYVKFLVNRFKEIDEIPILSLDDTYRSSFVYMFSNGQTQMLDEAVRFCSLSIEEQLRDYFLSFAYGCYMEWLYGDLVDEYPDLMKLCKVAAHLARDYSILEALNPSKKERKTSVDYVETLMVYMDTKSVTKTTEYFSRSLDAIGEDTIRKRLKKIADPYKHIDHPDHRLFELAQFAYKHWKSRSLEV